MVWRQYDIFPLHPLFCRSFLVRGTTPASILRSGVLPCDSAIAIYAPSISSDFTCTSYRIQMATIHDTITLIFPQRLLHTEHNNSYYHSNMATYWQGVKEEYRQTHFQALSQNCKQRLLASSCLPVCPFAGNNLAANRQIFMKFYIWILF